MKHPERTLARALILGVLSYAACAFGLKVTVAAPIFAALSVGAFFFAYFTYGRKFIKSLVAAALAAAFCVFGTVGGFFLTKNRESAEALVSDEEHRIVATVESVSYSNSFNSRVVARVGETDGEKTDMLVSVDFPYAPELFERDVFVAVGHFKGLDKYETYYESDGVYVSFEATDSEYIKTEKAGIFYKIRGLGAALSEKLASNIGGFEGRLASAISLGDKSGLPSRMKLDFKRAGASHVLAVSGMHLSVIILSLRFILSALERKKRNVILIAASLLYMALTGFSPSVCRAAIMMTIYLIGDIFGEKSDGITSLAISMAIILAIWPSAVYGAGFWLSCAATFGILVVVPSFKLAFLYPKKTSKRPLKILKKVARFVLTLLIASAAAQMFTMPMTFFVFGGVSALSIFAGILIIPLAEAALILSMIACVFAYVPFLSAFFAFLAKVPLMMTVKTTEAFSSVEGVYISLRQPFTVYIIAAAGILTLAIILIKKLDKRLILSVGALAAAAFAVCLCIFNAVSAGNTDIIYSRSGSNESIVVSSRGNIVVTDISNGGFSALESTAIEVNNIYREEIDWLMLTHLHANHIGSVSKLTSVIKVNNILLPTAENEDDASVIRNIELLVGDRVKLHFYNRESESEMEIDGVKLILPTYVTLKRSTHPVIALAVEENGHRVSYVGASALDAHDVYVNDIYSNCDVLIVGAHGPKIKETIDLKYTAAGVAVIAVGSGFVDADEYGGEVRYADETEYRFTVRFQNGE